MEQFLKQYSTVPNGFIEDFFNIAKEIYNDKSFAINFDIVIKWFDMRKDSLKRTLINNFEEQYDYVIERIKIKNENGKGANTREKIFLTPDCFKELSMVLQTAKAKEVRKYYLSIEKLIRKYHEYIEEKLNKKIGLLENNNKPKINKKGGVIYVLQAQNSDITLYKLGKTMNINKRLKTYNTGNANDIEPVFIMEVDNVTVIENCVKNLIKEFQYRKYKEVYEINIDILKKAIESCDELACSFKYYSEHPEELKKKYNQMKEKKKMFMVFDKK